MLESSSEFLRHAIEKTSVSSTLNEMIRMTNESSNQSPIKAKMDSATPIIDVGNIKADITLPPDKCYTAKESAEFLNMSESNFREWRRKFNKEHPTEPITGIKNAKNRMYHHFDLERLKVYAAPKMKNTKDDDSSISLLDELQPQQEIKNAPTTIEATDLIIDDKFKNLIQPLTESEFKQLEDDILQNGITNPVTVIRDEACKKFIVIDGHHRRQIAAKYNLPLPLKEMKFSSREDAAMWMVKNQFARRNLSTFSKALLVLKMKPVFAKQAKENQLAALKQNTVYRSAKFSKTVDGVDTRMKMAKMVGISSEQMRRIELIANEASDEMKQAILNGDLSVHKAYEELRAANKALEPNNPARVESVNNQEEIKPPVFNEAFQQPESLSNQNELEAENAALKNEIAQLKQKSYNTQGTANNERYTPPAIIELVKEVLKTIDLDPASCSTANETVMATNFYNSDDDGLSKEWTGKIFMNPPYSKDLIEKFVDKLINSQFDEAITLTHNCTETSWGSKLLKNAAAVSFPTGRIDCKTPAGDGGSPKQGSMICYFGSNSKKFIDVFSRIGICLTNERRII